jgi:hypothetical protein
MFRVAVATFGLLMTLPMLPAGAQGYHYNQGYVRQDGTYVPPHYQTNPDGNPYNNWSTQGNVNPFTGQAGTHNPYSSYQRW